MRFALRAVLMIACAAIAFSQVTSRLEGTVTDPQGAAVVNAQITVSNIATGQNFDLQNTNDTDGRIVEFVIKFNF